jgi:hypothetical protein
MRTIMRMFFFAFFANALAAGVGGNQAFAQEENREKKVATFGQPGIGAARKNPSSDLLELLQAQSLRATIGVARNAPFSGEMVCECIPTPADGNRTVHRTKTLIHRDGMGRIRQEYAFKIQDANSGEYKEHQAIEISDRFGGQDLTLDPQNRTARKSVRPPIKGFGDSITVQAVGFGGILNGAAIPPGNPCGLGRFGPNPEMKSESLGSQVIEGLAAEGARTIYIIPAGSMANERPIEVIQDRWYSTAFFTRMRIYSHNLQPTRRYRRL